MFSHCTYSLSFLVPGSPPKICVNLMYALYMLHITHVEHTYCTSEAQFGVAVSLWTMQLRTLIYLAVVADFGVPILPGFYIPISATICLAQSLPKFKSIEGEGATIACCLCAKFYGTIQFPRLYSDCG